MKRHNLFVLLLALILLLVISATQCDEAVTPNPEEKQSGTVRLQPDMSLVGNYIGDNGYKIRIMAVDAHHIFAAMMIHAPHGWFETNAIWTITNADRTNATFDSEDLEFKHAEVTILKDRIIVEANTRNAWGNSTYRRQNGWRWQKNSDGSMTWLDKNGKPEPNFVSPDGWNLDNKGRKDTSQGMTPFNHGNYRGKVQDHQEWINFTLIGDGWDDTSLAKGQRRKKVGTAYYSEQYIGGWIEKNLVLYNTTEGYVLEESDGKIFGWLYPVNDETGIFLMIQKYGESEYTAFLLVGRTSD